MTIEHWFNQEGTLKGLRQLGDVLSQAQVLAASDS